MDIDFAYMKDMYEQADEEYKRARDNRKVYLRAMQAACSHALIVEHGRPQRLRACVSCGLWENAPIADPGDEYDYATYGEFKILTGKPYQVTREELFRTRLSDND